MEVRYDYFGNTSLRVKNLLYNFESQLILFEELFSNANEKDIWSNDSELQLRYLELLQRHKLLENKNKTAQLGTKDARVKSAPLEDYNLIKRKEKLITASGYELLKLLQNEAYKITNDFLQIDLISLFFLKATLNFSKSKDLLYKYLEVFKEFKGELSLEIFKFLPLVNNFTNTKEFIQAIKEQKILSYFIDEQNLELLLSDLETKSLKIEYFRTAKGDKTAKSIIATLEQVFLKYRDSKDLKLLENLLSPSCKIEFLDFKKLYLKSFFKSSKKEQRLKELATFITEGNLKDFGIRFYTLIYNTRILANLSDYYDLNRRYLNLTGIFDFSNNKISLEPIFKMIIAHSCYKELLVKIATSEISQGLLSEYFNDKEFLDFFKAYNITKAEDLKEYKRKLDKQKLQALIDSKFQKERVIELLRLFSDRKNDETISELTTTEASIPTIFEYVIALAWYYFDECKLERILDAKLSLDSKLLPKSHAIGGEADFVFAYKTHNVMIEATLTEKTNQRRAEMESVSRHLGNMLLSLDASFQKESFGIFIAPYLDKNVLNDFRARIYTYFEDTSGFVRGMNILPLSTQDLILLLESNVAYKDLVLSFQKLFQSKNDWGSKWYDSEVKSFINSL